MFRYFFGELSSAICNISLSNVKITRSTHCNHSSFGIWIASIPVKHLSNIKIKWLWTSSRWSTQTFLSPCTNLIHISLVSWHILIRADCKALSPMASFVLQDHWTRQTDEFAIRSKDLINWSIFPTRDSANYRAVTHTAHSSPARGEPHWTWWTRGSGTQP